MMTANLPACRPSCATAVAVLMLFVCCGCNKGDDRSDGQPPDNGSSRAGSGPLRVVATISIIGDWAHIIGDDDINLTTLVGPDGDPHEYEPVPTDNIAVAQSRIVLENGLGLETWLDKLYASSQSKAARVAITNGIAVRSLPSSDSAPSSAPEGDRDPHAWQDVENAIVMVTNIRTALSSADPQHASAYQSRAKAYLLQLEELDLWTGQQIKSLPPQRRILVTSHDAFGYFGQRYGMNVTRNALESVTSEASDPSAGQIADTVARIKSAGVPMIFLENIQNRKLVDEIAKEASVKVAPPLYSDALGSTGTPGDSYLKMIRYNVNTMVKALAQ